jgi:hypothetical protein
MLHWYRSLTSNIVFLEILWDAHIGIMSTRNVPGIMALVVASTASIAARRNGSSLLVIFKPYVFSITSPATALATDTTNGNYEKKRSVTRKYPQFDMIEKTVRGLSEAQEQAVGVLALIIIEVCYRPRIKELVEKSTVAFPQVPVFHDADIPGEMTHP